MKNKLVRFFLLLLMCLSTVQAQTDSIRFAVIGDYGKAGADAEAVANLVKSWEPDFIITTGDNNYPSGSAATIDANIGQYYHEYIGPYSGSYGEGAAENRFFPTLGNHDWDSDEAQPYLNYFTLPGNERYYDFVKGPVHFFALDNNYAEPDGFSSTSIQAEWLRNGLANSTAAWQVVYMHVAPYSSGWHGSNELMQWPFAEWGADAVVAGHEHLYERLTIDGIPYFVNGAGGGGLYKLGTWVEGSEVVYNRAYGAMLVEANSEEMTFAFYTVDGTVVDAYTVSAQKQQK